MRERLRELVDRIVVARDGRVSAAIRRRHSKIRRDFFGGAHGVDEWRAVAERSAAAFVQRIGGVDLLPVVGDEPAYTVRRSTLFVGREHEEDVAVRDVALLLETQQVGDEDRAHRLVVARAASVVVAVALRELERVDVGRPIALQRLDDVEMREQQGSACARRCRGSE